MQSFIEALLSKDEIIDAKERWDMAQTYFEIYRRTGKVRGVRAAVRQAHVPAPNRAKNVSKDRVARVCDAAEMEGSGYRLVFDRLTGRGGAS